MQTLRSKSFLLFDPILLSAMEDHFEDTMFDEIMAKGGKTSN